MWFGWARRAALRPAAGRSRSGRIPSITSILLVSDVSRAACSCVAWAACPCYVTGGSPVSHNPRNHGRVAHATRTRGRPQIAQILACEFVNPVVPTHVKPPRQCGFCFRRGRGGQGVARRRGCPFRPPAAPAVARRCAAHPEKRASRLRLTIFPRFSALIFPKGWRGYDARSHMN